MRAAREKGMGEYLPLLISRRENHMRAAREKGRGIFAPVDQQERKPHESSQGERKGNICPC